MEFIKKIFKEWILPIVIAFGICFVVTRFIMFIAVIPSSSMVPTLNVKDRLIVTRVFSKDNIKHGDIVVFNKDGEKEPLVKRVIGLGGDEIVLKQGVLYRNGTLIDEPYVKNHLNYTGEFKVPEGKVFFLGDNRPNSGDSSQWEDPYIAIDNVFGKVLLKIYPFKDFGSVE